MSTTTKPYSLHRSEEARQTAIATLANAWIANASHVSAIEVETHLPGRGLGDVLVRDGTAVRCTSDEWQAAIWNRSGQRPATRAIEITEDEARGLAAASPAEPLDACTVAGLGGRLVVEAAGFGLMLAGDTLYAFEDEPMRVRAVARWSAATGTLASETAVCERGEHRPAYLDEPQGAGGYCFETPYRPIWCEEPEGYVDDDADAAALATVTVQRCAKAVA